MMTRPRVFVWATGQDDNIGDVVLRRRLLACLDVPRSSIDLYVGVNSDGYASSLITEIRHAEVRLHRRKSGWVIAMMRAACTRRVIMVANPGEIWLDGSTLLSHSLLLAPQWWVRVRGGDVVRAGVALRQTRGVIPSIVVALLRLSQRSVSLSSWRDTSTGPRMGAGAVVPDWAFSPGPTAVDGDRRVVMVTFRSDRAPLDDAECRALRRYADRTGQRLEVFVQVRHDSAAMAELAGRLGADLVPWPDSRDHAEQERLLRDHFRAASLVISDRIHALIMGSGEGALPAGVHDPSDHKIRRHFVPAGLHDATFARTGSGDDLAAFLFSVVGARERTLSALVTAAGEVDALGRRLTRLVQVDEVTAA
ncbi:hypothetical protein HQ308_13530 [Rhodococcus sp. BP-241]|uniref:hypothetical protein n=1 Tax=Rhodococcus sp. BP-241 TaxID=2739441 RepID=UPI001C9A4452|nr:hypothetical protein [Rhodococcus sp. BP-241]MBY6707823.1 hypothetical protein [Rhodococcus sp. BP-241]